MQENQNTPNTQQNNQETLRIVQYNTHNSDPVQIPFLHKAAKGKIQIIAIQEPSLNKYTKGTATHPDYWTAISPSGKARICFYISKDIKTKQPCRCIQVGPVHGTSKHAACHPARAHHMGKRRLKNHNRPAVHIPE